MTNKILDNAGLVDVPDPRAIVSPDDTTIQGSLAGRLADEIARHILNYESLPLYGENILIAMLQDIFMQDDLFPYIAGDPVQSRIAITVHWSRDALVQRDRRPLLVVGFQEASADEVLLGNRVSAAGIGQLPSVDKSLLDISRFRIMVVHHNRNIVLYLAQKVRAGIAGAMDALREIFNLTKVYPPSLSGPTNLDEYPDLFVASIDLRFMAMPRWRQSVIPEYIKRIRVTALASAFNLLEEGLSQEIRSDA